MLGKHLLRINRNKGSGTAGQDFALFIFDLSRVDMPATVQALFVGNHRQRLPQWYRPQIFDFHGSGKSQHIAELVHFAHGFIQDGGNNAAMGMAWRPGVSARKLEMADGLARLFVQRELQFHALRIVMSATKAMVLAGLRFALDRVAVCDFAFCHWDREEILTSAKVTLLLPHDQLRYALALGGLVIMQDLHGLKRMQ
jgi:hypothetical protein